MEMLFAQEFNHLFCYPSMVQQINELRCSTFDLYVQINQVQVASVEDPSNCNEEPKQGCGWATLSSQREEFQKLFYSCLRRSRCIVDAREVLEGSFQPCGTNRDRSRNAMRVYYTCSSSVPQSTRQPPFTMITTATRRTFRTFPTLFTRTGSEVTHSTTNATQTTTDRNCSEETTPTTLSDTQLILLIFFSCLLLLLIILVIFLIVKYRKIQRLKLEVSQEGHSTL